MHQAYQAPEYAFCKKTDHNHGLSYAFTHQSDGSTYEHCQSCGHVRNYRSARRNYWSRKVYWTLRAVLGRELTHYVTGRH